MNSRNADENSNGIFFFSELAMTNQKMFGVWQCWG